MKKYFAIFVCVLCISVTLALMVQAAAPVPEEDSTLTIHFMTDDNGNGVPISGAELFLYYVAEYKSDGTYALTTDFEDSNIAADFIESDWNEAGVLTDTTGTLYAYIADKKLDPVASGTTDGKGYCTLTVGYPEKYPGVYLLCGKPIEVVGEDGKWIYTPQASLIPLPYPKSTITWEYKLDIEMKGKYKKEKPDETISITVSKVWEGDGKHPDSVTARLLCDGEVYDEVELNEGNNWKYTWNDMKTGHEWQIVEKDVPKGYRVTVSQNEYVFVITNIPDVPETTPPETTPPETIPPETTPPETTPPETTPPETTPPETTPETTPPETEPPEKLPQTGQLLWPVPVFIGFGIVIIAVGLLLRKHDEDSAKRSDR